MKAFLLIYTSMWSSILSSRLIVWFDTRELIMNDQAMPPKQEQPEKEAYTGTEEEEGYECLGWVGCHPTTETELDSQSSSALPLFFSRLLVEQ